MIFYHINIVEKIEDNINSFSKLENHLWLIFNYINSHTLNKKNYNFYQHLLKIYQIKLNSKILCY